MNNEETFLQKLKAATDPLYKMTRKDNRFGRKTGLDVKQKAKIAKAINTIRDAFAEYVDETTKPKTAADKK